MKLSLSQVVASDRERVFDALVDPAILQRCIPGCESLVAAGPDTYDATVKIGVAGFKGTYTGRTTIANRQRPGSLTLAMEGKGGPGFVRGTAALTLTPDDSGTRIVCDADVQVGGLIAAVGSRLIDAAAQKLGREFFTELEKQIHALSRIKNS